MAKSRLGNVSVSKLFFSFSLLFSESCVPPSLCFFKCSFVYSFYFLYLSFLPFFLSPVFFLLSVLFVPCFFHCILFTSLFVSSFFLHPSFNNFFFVSFFSLKIPLCCVLFSLASILPCPFPFFLLLILLPPSFMFLQINCLRAASCRNISPKFISTWLSYVLMWT